MANARRISLLSLLLAGVAGVFLLRDRDPGPAMETAEVVEGTPSQKPRFLPFRPVDAVSARKTPAVPVPLPESSEHAIPGEYTVAFSSAGDMQAFLREAEAAGIEILGLEPKLLAVRLRASGSALAPLLREGMQVDNNYLMEAPSFPSPEFYRAGNLSGFNADALAFLGVPENRAGPGWGSGVTIAILDTGISGHSAFRNGSVRELNLLEGPREGDFSGHGTAVAGMIGSTNAFAPGIAPGSNLLAVRVLDGNGRGNAFTLATGIVQAVDNGANIINMSLGGYGNSDVLRQAVNYATENGVLLVAASGNDGLGQVTYPAAYPEVIGVTAVDANGDRTPFSNFGNGVDVAAPGYQLHALWENDEFIYFDGTSAAAPLVAGMAARIMETERAGSPAEIRELIRLQANEAGLPGDDIQYGAGILNAGRIESVGKTGIVDVALADLYPATEQGDGTTFPLYVTLENRGTDYLAGATIEISVNGTPYFYRFSGVDQGAIESIQIPVQEALLERGDPYRVEARVTLPGTYTDSRPDNNQGEITLIRKPGE